LSDYGERLLQPITVDILAYAFYFNSNIQCSLLNFHSLFVY